MKIAECIYARKSILLFLLLRKLAAMRLPAHSIGRTNTQSALKHNDYIASTCPAQHSNHHCISFQVRYISSACAIQTLFLLCASFTAQLTSIRLYRVFGFDPSATLKPNIFSPGSTICYMFTIWVAFEAMRAFVSRKEV